MKLNQSIKYLKKFTLIDMLFLGYMCFLSLLILLMPGSVDGWYLYVAAHAVLIVLILVMVPVLENSSSSILVFIRWWYPVLLFTFNYKEINGLTHVIFQNWMDGSILNIENALFGVHPTLWLERFVSPFVTEIMKADYFTYYLMIPVGAGVLYFTGRKKEYIRYLSTVCLAFYISYAGFILYPVRGPRYTLYDRYTKDYPVRVGDYYGPYVEKDVAGKATYALKGYFFTDLQDVIMKYGSLHGGCMPSSHIAVAFVCMIMMWLYRRRVFYIYLPFVSLLCLAVVYNRYHYVSDVGAGLAVGLLALWLTPRLQGLWKRVSKSY